MRTVYAVVNATPFRWLITLVWTIFLTVILVQPENQPLIPTGVQPGPPSWQRELYFSSLHLLFFGLTSALWSWALYKHLSLLQSVCVAVVLVFCLGLVTELAQGRIPGRSPQLIDMLANGIGALFGAWIFYRWLADFVQRWTAQIVVL